jgi:hypothetical protein
MATVRGGVQGIWPITIEQTSVARYTALGDTANGFTVTTDNDAGDFQGIEFPGVVPLPAVIFYRTRQSGLPRFSVTINSVTVTEYAFTENDPPERCWHEIIPAGVGGEATLKAQNNELIFGVTSDDGTGAVTFGDVVIFYTSNETTIAIPLRSIGEPL